LTLPNNVASATVTRVITEVGVNTPRAEAVKAASGGTIALKLDSTPVFVEAK
jgi:hypothetical protein